VSWGRGDRVTVPLMRQWAQATVNRSRGYPLEFKRRLDTLAGAREERDVGHPTALIRLPAASRWSYDALPATRTGPTPHPTQRGVSGGGVEREPGPGLPPVLGEAAAVCTRAGARAPRRYG
jgi:hypothetical protein